MKEEDKIKIYEQIKLEKKLCNLELQIHFDHTELSSKENIKTIIKVLYDQNKRIKQLEKKEK